jgi:hypothetical protein
MNSNRRIQGIDSCEALSGMPAGEPKQFFRYAVPFTVDRLNRLEEARLGE